MMSDTRLLFWAFVQVDLRQVDHASVQRAVRVAALSDPPTSPRTTHTHTHSSPHNICTHTLAALHFLWRGELEGA